MYCAVNPAFDRTFQTETIATHPQAGPRHQKIGVLSDPDVDPLAECTCHISIRLSFHSDP